MYKLPPYRPYLPIIRLICTIILLLNAFFLYKRLSYRTILNGSFQVFITCEPFSHIAMHRRTCAEPRWYRRDSSLAISFFWRTDS